MVSGEMLKTIGTDNLYIPGLKVTLSSSISNNPIEYFMVLPRYRGKFFNHQLKPTPRKSLTDGILSRKRS
jgi:hypothetical protein